MLVLLVCVCFVDVACMAVMIGLVGDVVGILVLGVCLWCRRSCSCLCSCVVEMIVSRVRSPLLLLLLFVDVVVMVVMF